MKQIGHYSVIEEIGRGGQATVYLAEDSRLKRKVALKVLSETASAAAETLERFRREAEVASRLDHPGICPVYDAGVEGGIPFIAMRYVEGESLARRIARQAARGVATSGSVDLESGATLGSGEPAGATSAVARPRLSRDEIIENTLIVEKVARALHAAHELGVIHRDVKPANVIVTPGNEPVLLDLGLARDESADHQTLTRTGDVFGTPAYMSPEQLTGQRIRSDRRTDVYALGATLYEAVTLRRPFEAPTREALYQAILTDSPSDARRINPRMPVELKIVMETALEKNRNRRYQTALALADDLARIRKHEPIKAKPPGPILRLQRWVQRRPALATSVAGLVVALGLLGYGLGAASKASEHARLQRQAEAERDRADAALARLGQAERDAEIRTVLMDLDTQVGAIIYGGSAILGPNGTIDLKPYARQYLKAYSDFGLRFDQPDAAATVMSRLSDLRARDPKLWSTVTLSLDMFHYALRNAAGGPDAALAQASPEVLKVKMAIEHDPWDRDLSEAEAKFRADGTDEFSPFLDETKLGRRSGTDLRRLGAILMGVPDREEQGRKLIDRALELEPDNFGLRVMRGGLAFMDFREKQDPQVLEPALLDYTAATALRPKSGLARCMLGIALALRSDFRRALECIDQATQVEPGNALVWTVAADFYSRSPMMTEKAIEAARRALELDPSITRAREVLKESGATESR